MYHDHKPINEQTIVITGASSGIGLTTACMAVKKGAKVVLASRNEDALKDIVDELKEQGGEACYVVADVGDFEDAGKISKKAIDEYGGFDTWVNNAGILVFGRCEDTTLEDQHQLFKTNYFGTVHGSLIALKHLKKHGGALINVGSVDSDRAIPLQGPYSATKHAVKAWTDALRMELEYEDAPVSVSLIKPASIDTPLLDHAKSYLEDKPELPPPVYDPILVAKSILHCAQHPKRDIIVGGGGQFLSNLGMYGRSADRFQEAVHIRQQHSGEAPGEFGDEDNLYDPSFGGEMYGSHEGRTHRTSPYTFVQRHPTATATSAAGVLLGVLAATGIGLWMSRRQDYQSGNRGWTRHESRALGGGAGWTTERYEREYGSAAREHEAARYRGHPQPIGEIWPGWS